MHPDPRSGQFLGGLRRGRTPALGANGQPVTRVLSGELSGAFADLGVLIPLEAALIAVNGLNPTSTLVGVGVAYVLAGRYFGIPMPVQPLKAFAVLAVAHQASPAVIAAGSLWMALLLGLMAATGLVHTLARWTPVGVVRGTQLGLGLLLLKNGWDFITARPFLIGGEQVLVHVSGWSVPLGVPAGLLGGALLLVLLRWRRLPATLVVLALGGLAGVAVRAPGALWPLALGPAAWAPELPGPEDLLLALPLLVVPQLPLTLANSVLATSDAAASYFGRRALRVTPRALSFSIALGNLWAGLAGGLPMCHGSGGLTAHYRLGARTPLATALLGVLLVGGGLLLGQAALQARSVVPYPIYGVLLAYVGLEHLKLGWAVPHRRARAVALLTAAVGFATNLAFGAAAGVAAAVALHLSQRLPRPASQPAD